MADDALLIGKSTKQEWLALRFGNRHGLITGATGTGKTVTLQVLAEGFSNAGVPVFAADIKGDLSGICQPWANRRKSPSTPSKLMAASAVDIGMGELKFAAAPTIFWDIYGKNGHPIRATDFAEMGPQLLSRLHSAQ